MSKRTHATKALSMLLALILVLSLFPIMGASAAGTKEMTVGQTMTLTSSHANESYYSFNWSSDNTSVVKINGSTTGKTATIEAVGSGTATISDGGSMMGVSNADTWTIAVTGSGSGGGDGVTAIRVTKEWKNDSASDRPNSVTVYIKDGNTTAKTLTLNSSNNWTATATGLDASKSYTVEEASVPGYTSEVNKGADTTSSSGSSGWAAPSIRTILQQVLSKFVNHLFNSFSRLFGRR